MLAKKAQSKPVSFSILFDRIFLLPLMTGVALAGAATPSTFASPVQGVPSSPAGDSAAFLTEARLKGTITKVSDGDTVHFVVDQESGFKKSPSFPNGIGNSLTGNRLKVRMTGIDTPELHLPVPGGMASQGYWAEQAWHRLEELLPLGARAELVDYGKDHYGRTLGRIYINSLDVHSVMLAEGLAALYLICKGESCNESFYRENKVTEYVKACGTAVRGNLGIFAPISGLDELPFEFRLRMQKREADKWVGNLRTKELVAPADYAKVPVCDRVFFPIRDEAERMGYRGKTAAL